MPGVRIKARYTVYQPAWRKGVQTCGVTRGKKAEKKKKSRKKTKKTSKSRLQLADWAIILTNVPAEQMTAEEALVVMRTRLANRIVVEADGQQYGKIDAWPSREACTYRDGNLRASILGLLIQRDHDHSGLRA